MYVNECDYDVDFSVFQVKSPLSSFCLLYFIQYDKEILHKSSENVVSK